MLYAKLSLEVLRAVTPRRMLGKSQITMKLKSRETIACGHTYRQKRMENARERGHHQTKKIREPESNCKPAVR